MKSADSWVLMPCILKRTWHVRTVSPLSSGFKSKPNKKPMEADVKPLSASARFLLDPELHSITILE
jgi:hypothetical protein